MNFTRRVKLKITEIKWFSLKVLRNDLVKREKLIRNLLPSCPWWARGHLELAFLQLQTEESERLAVVNLSLEAARKILSVDEAQNTDINRKLIELIDNELRG